MFQGPTDCKKNPYRREISTKTFFQEKESLERKLSPNQFPKITISYASPKNESPLFNKNFLGVQEKPNVKNLGDGKRPESIYEKESNMEESKITKHTRNPSETIYSKSNFAEKKYF